MKILIDTDELEIKLIVNKTDAMDVIDSLELFDTEEWDEYEIIVDGETQFIQVPVSIQVQLP